MNDTTTALRASGLTKDFGERRAVSDVTFDVARGGAFGLLGPNGSGKTTIIRLLNGLLAPTSGSVEVLGTAMTPANADRLRERIGVQTDTNLYESLSVDENLRTWGALYGMSSAAIESRIREVLDVLGLGERRASLVGQLSKGMRQKVAIARAVLHTPELLFLDEPTAGLDPEAAADLIDYLRGLIRTGDTTVVLTTHQLHGLETLCDHLGILRAGALVTAGEVDELLAERWPHARVRLALAGDLTAARAVLAESGVADPAIREDGSVSLELPDDRRVSDLVVALVGRGVAIDAVVPHVPTIEELYFSVVQEGPRA
ncbi:ABC transporter ATP-binding protein [Salinibacterium sp. ZJ70]|uniref:ABC transporter ATP-binding protein n=1 Tax=Salinibacterium sp. ZJ70 TaxID=2708084 RepID=UPI001421668A|nr:ABC transporter ATP-binding protein [Salinibacterium sp. ZJ70]